MKPVPVKFIRFSDQSMELPGCHSSSLTSNACDKNGHNKKHKIEFHPWARGFWVELYDKPPRPGADVELVDACYVPDSMVMHWKPVDGPVPVPVRPAASSKKPR